MMSIKSVKIPGVGMRNVKTALAAAFCAFASGTAILGLRLFQREREFRFRRRGMDGSRQWRKFIASGGTRETSEAYFTIAHAPHALPGIQSVGPAAHTNPSAGD